MSGRKPTTAVAGVRALRSSLPKSHEWTERGAPVLLLAERQAADIDRLETDIEQNGVRVQGPPIPAEVDGISLSPLSLFDESESARGGARDDRYGLARGVGRSARRLLFVQSSSRPVAGLGVAVTRKRKRELGVSSLALLVRSERMGQLGPGRVERPVRG